MREPCQSWLALKARHDEQEMWEVKLVKVEMQSLWEGPFVVLVVVGVIDLEKNTCRESREGNLGGLQST